MIQSFKYNLFSWESKQKNIQEFEYIDFSSIKLFDWSLELD